MRKWVAIFVAGLILSLALAGCSGEKEQQQHPQQSFKQEQPNQSGPDKSKWPKQIAAVCGT
jgi:uncharacterized protein YcfL